MLATPAGGLEFMAFPGLSRLFGLTHAVSTRAGGMSAPPFDSLNLGQGDDDASAVAANLERLRDALGLTRLVWNHQVHGTQIVAVEEQSGSPLAEADGLAADRPGVGLLIKQADCQAVILAAPQRGVVANLHVGWRGNAAGMPAKGVEFLAGRYGVKPHEIHAAVSPGLGACCAQFVNAASELPGWFSRFRVNQDHFDLEAATLYQLEKAGVDPANMETSGVCTKCDERFFSYRRDGLTGRFGTVVALK